jgi:hypothetical protein
VDDYVAIRNGALANNPLFFGSNTSEAIGAANSYGGWNGDIVDSARSGAPWFFRGADSSYGAYAGMVAFNDGAGGVNNDRGHRTILSGY